MNQAMRIVFVGLGIATAGLLSLLRDKGRTDPANGVDNVTTDPALSIDADRDPNGGDDISRADPSEDSAPGLELDKAIDD